jgi:transposase
VGKDGRPFAWQDFMPWASRALSTSLQTAPSCALINTVRARKKGAETQALARSRGGISRKTHLATDAPGYPVRLILTGGHRNDITQIEPLLDGSQVDFVLVDKGYDGARAMEAIAAAGATPVVPRRSTTASWRAFDAHLYKERNAVERFFSKIKHLRCIATRHDKVARNYPGFTNLVCALKWCT